MGSRSRGSTRPRTLFVPPVVDADRIGGASTTTEEDGTELRCTPISVSRDEAARLQTTLLRYERRRPGGDAEVVERPWTLHWHTQDGFSALAASAGLAVVKIVGIDGSAAAQDATAFTFVLVRA